MLLYIKAHLTRRTPFAQMADGILWGENRRTVKKRPGGTICLPGVTYEGQGFRAVTHLLYFSILAAALAASSPLVRI